VPWAVSIRDAPGSANASEMLEPSLGEMSDRTKTPSASMRLVVLCMARPPPENRTGTTSRMVLDMDEASRAAWIKDVTSNDAKALRRMDDLLEATYQKYRGELRAGRDISSEPMRLQMRKDIEADPDLEVDRNAPKDVITDQEMEKRYPELAKWKDEIQAKRYGRRNQSKIPPNYIEASWDVSKTPSPTYVLARGNYLAPGSEVQPGLPLVLDNPQHPLEFPDPAKHPEWNGTNRRLILAKWMVSRENPLVPRVFVNRVWQWHFGEGIVRSADDFGVQGAKPTHPELLDYLTVSFEEHNWDLKWLTKEIMMSQVYRQASAEVPQYLAADPGDKLLWRKAPLRIEAETIRDSMLKVSGLLNERMFGKQEPIKRGPDGQWLEDNQGSGASRRSLYLAQTRTRSVAFLHAFDCPDMTSDNQSERFRSSLPTQSLALMNNPLVMRTSKAFAAEVLERSGNNYEDAVKMAFDVAYNRPPTAKEQEIARKSIHQPTAEQRALGIRTMPVQTLRRFGEVIAARSCTTGGFKANLRLRGTRGARRSAEPSAP